MPTESLPALHQLLSLVSPPVSFGWLQITALCREMRYRKAMLLALIGIRIESFDEGGD
jgi:hypothetical protein